MSDKKVVDDGGQAYPRNYAYVNPESGRSELMAFPGMTKREYFAGQALVGYRAHPADVPDKQIPWVAEYCVKIADALIAELKKQEAGKMNCPKCKSFSTTAQVVHPDVTVNHCICGCMYDGDNGKELEHYNGLVRYKRR